MSFWLTDESQSVEIFLANAGEVSNILFPNFSQFDNDASRGIMETVDVSFSTKLSLNSNQYVSQNLSGGQRFLQLHSKWNPGKKALSLRLEGHILKILGDVLGEDLEVRVVLTGMRIHETPSLSQLPTRGNGTVTKGMKISVMTKADQAANGYYPRGSHILGQNSGERVKVGICVDDDVKLLLEQTSIRGIGEVDAKIRVQVTITSFNSLIFPSGTGTEMMKRINTKILTAGVHTDVKIIASNGQAINAHKCFLSAQSPVFAAMFRTECNESLTDTVEIPDMSEETLKALLAYLYVGDVTAAEESSEIALDLLEAGHTYQVNSLEECSKQILLRKPKQWVDVGVALRVFNLSGNIAGREDLKAMSLQVMKLKFRDLKESDEYKQLFSKDAQSAMELCNSILETWNSNN